MPKQYWLVILFDYCSLFIMVTMTTQVWKALIDSPAYESDREACFKWFARVCCYIYIYIYIYTYVCVHVHTCIHAYVHVCVCMGVCVCLCVHMRVCVYVKRGETKEY